jgi:hypothetical protein
MVVTENVPLVLCAMTLRLSNIGKMKLLANLQIGVIEGLLS